MVRESIIEMMAECPISVITDLACNVIELYDVFDDMLFICHEQEAEFVLSVRDWIVRSKVFSEFCDKRRVTGHPQGMGFRGVEEDVRLEPL